MKDTQKEATKTALVILACLAYMIWYAISGDAPTETAPWCYG